MKLLQLTILLSISMFFVLSCSSETNSESRSDKKSDQTDYTGVYKSTEDGCIITITIFKDANGYSYKMNADGFDKNGKLTINQVDKETYLNFDNKTEGKFMDGLIMIQNYGNSMNEYQIFEFCDSKFLQFSK